MNINGIKYFNRTNNSMGNNWLINFSSFSVNEDDGSIICKVSEDFLESREEGLVIALYLENSLNMETFCDDQYMSNFDMTSFLYDSYFDLIYIIPYSVSDEFMQGKEVTIYGHTPSEEELLEIEKDRL